MSYEQDIADTAMALVIGHMEPSAGSGVSLFAMQLLGKYGPLALIALSDELAEVAARCTDPRKLSDYRFGTDEALAA